MKQKRIVVDVEPEYHKRLKQLAVEKETTIKALMLKAIERLLKEE